MKILFSFLSLLIANPSFANTNWTKNAVEIKRGTELHQMIDEITLEIFNSPLKKTLCNTYRNPTSVYHSLGVSEKTAIAVFAGCDLIASAPAKTISKRYYLSFNSEPRLDSWTDYGNRTYIFTNQNLTRSHLKSILLHEIAMSTDAKTNMYYTGYLNYRAQERTSIQGNGIFINLDSLSKHEQALQSAFNMAGWGPLSRTFATIRAFQIELLSQNKQLNMSQHHQCTGLVRDIFYKTRYLPEPPKSQDVDAIVEDLANLVDAHIAPKTREQEIALLNFVLSKDLTLKGLDNRKVTFCQFMITPLLTGRSLHSFLSAGPRPRLTGGSGGQGRDDSDKNISWEAQLRKSLEKNDFRIQDNQLQDAIEKLKSKSGIRQVRD